MWRAVFLGGLVLALPVAALPAQTPSEPRTDVTVYGTDWCGPCRAVNAFLDDNQIRFRFRDVDNWDNALAFARNRPRTRWGSIPFVVVGEAKVHGSNLDTLAEALRHAGYRVADLENPSGDPLYGGHPSKWWEAELDALRAEVERAKGNVVQKGVEVLHKRDELRRLEEVLYQLEMDAEAANVPGLVRRK